MRHVILSPFQAQGLASLPSNTGNTSGWPWDVQPDWIPLVSPEIQPKSPGREMAINLSFYQHQQAQFGDSVPPRSPLKLRSVSLDLICAYFYSTTTALEMVQKVLSLINTWKKKKKNEPKVRNRWNQSSSTSLFSFIFLPLNTEIAILLFKNCNEIIQWCLLSTYKC